MLLDRLDTLKSTILLHKTYEDFIKYLAQLNAPADNFELFVKTIANIYSDDDFVAILIIIDENISLFNEYQTSNEVFREIIKEIMNDYQKYN